MVHSVLMILKEINKLKTIKMEKIKKFTKPNWLLNNKEELLIHGGRMASICYTTCNYDKDGTFCADDTERD